MIKKKTPSELKFLEEFLKIAGVAVKHSMGRLRMAHKEKPDNGNYWPTAAHFLKIDEKRLGRDIELYSFLCEINAQEALCDFLTEVLDPLKKKGLVESQKKAGELLYELGKKVYSKKLHQIWHDDIFGPKE